MKTGNSSILWVAVLCLWIGSLFNNSLEASNQLPSIQDDSVIRSIQPKEEPLVLNSKRKIGVHNNNNNNNNNNNKNIPNNNYNNNNDYLNKNKASQIINNYYRKKDTPSPISRFSNETKPVSVWLSWGGATCPQNNNGNCKSMYPNVTNVFPVPQYACSMPDGPGQWGNGLKYFLDPIPYGNVLVDVDLTFVGRFYCDVESPPSPKATYLATINDMLVSWNKLPNTLQGCSNCSSQGMCMQNVSFNSNEQYSDFSTYKYGQWNIFDITLVSNNICLYGINMTLSYAPIEIRLTSIEPTTGPTTGNTWVKVYGSGFINNSPNNGTNNSSSLWCRFQDLAVPAFYINETAITCKTPMVKQAGNMPVYASNNGQYYSTSSVQFLYYGTPVAPDKDDGFLEMLKKYWYICLAAGVVVICFVAGILTILLTKRKVDPRLYSLNPNDSLSPLLANGTFAFYSKDVKEDIDYREIQLAERIGRGNFGEVYKGYWRGTVVAIKKTKLPTATTESEAKEFLEDFEREAKIMRTLRHPNVLQFLGICKVPTTAEICIITEHMSRGNLNRILHDKSVLMSWELRLKIAIDVSRGMNYLHKSNPIIIHRDLKSYNLLVDDNFKVKVCDFGLAKLFTQPEGKTHEMTSCGTPAWTAPEVLRNENYTEKADIFSFGVVMWELVTREEPHHGMPPFQVVFAVGTQGVRPAIPSACPDELHHLIEECWNENPAERPSFDEIMKKLETLQHSANWI